MGFGEKIQVHSFFANVNAAYVHSICFLKVPRSNSGDTDGSTWNALYWCSTRKIKVSLFKRPDGPTVSQSDGMDTHIASIPRKASYYYAMMRAASSFSTFASRHRKVHLQKQNKLTFAHSTSENHASISCVCDIGCNMYFKRPHECRTPTGEKW
jgi:hypothetical protein